VVQMYGNRRGYTPSMQSEDTETCSMVSGDVRRSFVFTVSPVAESGRNTSYEELMKVWAHTRG